MHEPMHGTHNGVLTQYHFLPLQTRTIKKYRLGSTGTIDSMDVTYDAALQKATFHGVWSVDADMSRSRW